jgi:hypothetical protein
MGKKKCPGKYFSKTNFGTFPHPAGTSTGLEAEPQVLCTAPWPKVFVKDLRLLGIHFSLIAA